MSSERLIIPEDLIGKSSKEFIVWLAKENPQIAKFNFHFYEYRMPNPADFKEKIATPKEDLIIIERSELSKDKLENLLDCGYAQGLLLALNSNLLLKDGRVGQIPMMDFSCEINRKNEGLIKRLMKEINLPGFLIVSGNSYHTVSKELFIDNQRGWEKFLGKCLLSNLADYRYIGHCLDKGYSSLRISNSEKGNEPRIVDVIL